MSAHTPGPWRFNDGCERNGTVSADFLGLRIALMCAPSGGPTSETSANGRLIAQAPALLYWLSSIVRDLPANRDWLDPDIEREARAAIAAATGETE